jgi:hypothetical protein
LINYFNSLFTTQPFGASSADTQHHQIQIQDPFISSHPDVQEIHKLLKQMRRDASLGPDGLNVAFYREAWPWIAQDVMEQISHFYNTGNLPTHTNHTHIVIIPKNALFYSSGL